MAWTSSSSLRFGEMGSTMKFADVTGATTWGPGPFEPHHAQLDLSWYAIHPIELGFTRCWGRDARQWTRTSTDGADVIIGRWKDGRLGTVRAMRPYSDYGSCGVPRQGRSWRPSRRERGATGRWWSRSWKFFQDGATAGVLNEETLEIFGRSWMPLRSEARLKAAFLWHWRSSFA